MTEEKKENEKSPSELVQQANDAAERLEKANQESKELLKQAAEMKVQNTLGGTAEAGAEAKTKDLAEEEAKRLLTDTGYENELFPNK